MFNPTRRRVAIALTAMSAAPFFAALARAQDSAPVKLIVPYPPGGPADIVARSVTPAFAEELGRTIVIDNRAGASGTIGANAVAKSVPDGSTLLLNPSIHIIIPSLTPKLPYDAVKDFTHLGIVAAVPLVLAVNNDVPVHTVEELVAYAKANPGRVNFAHPGSGSSSHLAGEQLKLMAKLDIQGVAYKGSAPAITDLIGGRVQMMFDSGPSMMPFVKGAKVRALAVTTTERVRQAPELRTMIEAGFPGFIHSNWYGIWGPAGMPPAVTQKFIAALQKTMQRQSLRDRLMELGAEPVDNLYGPQFEAFAKSEAARFAKMVKDTGVTLD